MPTRNTSTLFGACPSDYNNSIWETRRPEVDFILTNGHSLCSAAAETTSLNFKTLIRIIYEFFRITIKMDFINGLFSQSRFTYLIPIFFCKTNFDVQTWGEDPRGIWTLMVESTSTNPSIGG